jgi:hypothetical protein
VQVDPPIAVPTFREETKDHSARLFEGEVSELNTSVHIGKLKYAQAKPYVTVKLVKLHEGSAKTTFLVRETAAIEPIVPRQAKQARDYWG